MIHSLEEMSLLRPTNSCLALEALGNSIVDYLAGGFGDAGLADEISHVFDSRRDDILQMYPHDVQKFKLSYYIRYHAGLHGVSYFDPSTNLNPMLDDVADIVKCSGLDPKALGQVLIVIDVLINGFVDSDPEVVRLNAEVEKLQNQIAVLQARLPE